MDSGLLPATHLEYGGSCVEAPIGRGEPDADREALGSLCCGVGTQDSLRRVVSSKAGFPRVSGFDARLGGDDTWSYCSKA